MDKGSSLPVTGVVDVSIEREEALHNFKQINWTSYIRSDAFALSQDEVNLFKEIESIDEQAGDAVETFLQGNGKTLCQALLKLIKNVTEPAVVKYALARMEQLLPDGAKLRSRVNLFVPENAVDSAPFLRLNRASSGYTEIAASQVLAKLICSKPSTSNLKVVIDWALECLNLGVDAEELGDVSKSSSARAAISALMILLRSEHARVIFAETGGMTLLADILNNSQGRAQLSYEVCFDLWTLTFCEEAIERFGSSGALRALIKKLISSPREKVIRVILSALHNLLDKNEGAYVEIMLEGGLLKTLNQLRDRKWSDEDVAADVKAVRECMIREYKELTTMERYEKELNSGYLNWGFLHTDQFWRENYMGFEVRDFEMIKTLIKLLESDNTTTVSVALYDLGDFVRFYPNGKMIAKRLGAKGMVMRLMGHEDASVKKHALQCISKMMVNKWEFVK